MIEHLEIQAVTDDITYKYAPSYVNIFCCLWGITLTTSNIVPGSTAFGTSISTGLLAK